MKLLREILGYGSLGGVAAILYTVAASLLSDDILGREDKLPILVGGLVAVGVGLIGMIVDMNTARDVSEAERERWRARLWWLGPLAAAWYFLSGPHRQRLEKRE